MRCFLYCSSNEVVITSAHANVCCRRLEPAVDDTFTVAYNRTYHCCYWPMLDKFYKKGELSFMVVASGDQKPRFWANFDTFGRSCTDPLLPMRAKFGVLEQTQALHLPAKFHLNVFIVSASGGKKPQFWTNFDIFGGSCIAVSYTHLTLPTIYSV